MRAEWARHRQLAQAPLPAAPEPDGPAAARHLSPAAEPPPPPAPVGAPPPEEGQGIDSPAEAGLRAARLRAPGLGASRSIAAVPGNTLLPDCAGLLPETRESWMGARGEVCGPGHGVRSLRCDPRAGVVGRSAKPQEDQDAAAADDEASEEHPAAGSPEDLYVPGGNKNKQHSA